MRMQVSHLLQGISTALGHSAIRPMSLNTVSTDPFWARSHPVLSSRRRASRTAFCPDAALRFNGSFADSGFQVLVLDSSAIVHQTYRMEGVYVWGNEGSGKFALDQ
jgi:hypothetical protein